MFDLKILFEGEGGGTLSPPLRRGDRPAVVVAPPAKKGEKGEEGEKGGGGETFQQV